MREASSYGQRTGTALCESSRIENSFGDKNRPRCEVQAPPHGHRPLRVARKIGMIHLGSTK
jgi:hypothetical protein